jgi:hypothetical protein
MRINEGNYPAGKYLTTGSLKKTTCIYVRKFIIHFIGTKDICSNQFTNNIKTYNILHCKLHLAN